MFLDKAIGSLAPAAARLCCCVQRERAKGERPESESRMAAGNLEKKAPAHLHAFETCVEEGKARRFKEQDCSHNQCF